MRGGPTTKTSRLFWQLTTVALALFTAVPDGRSQQEAPISWQFETDPFQFPVLTGRKAFQRWWSSHKLRAYPLAYIPERAQGRALEQIEQWRLNNFPTTQAVRGGRWVSIGPAPISGGQIGATGFTRPMSGRVADVAVNPSSNAHWLIAGAQGGIWRTTDAGATWTPLTDAQASLAMGAIAFAPSNPAVIYAGTGEAAFSGDAYAGAGLLKSTDGGNTWTLLAASTFAKTSFSDIKVNPTNPNILLASTTTGIAGRSNVFPPSIPPTGILKSTDGGVSWSLTRSGAATDLEVDPTNFSNQYAGIGNTFGGASNGIYRSTNVGDTWDLITGPWSTMSAGVGRVELAIAPSNPNTLYVSIQDAFNAVGTDGGLLGLFRTDNAWDPTPTWIQIPTGGTDNGTGVHGYCGWNFAFNSAAEQCWYDHEIIVDPTNANTLYAGGIELWKCTNCGASPTWSEISKTVSNPQNGIHVDQHTMAFAGSRLIVGNDGGVWSTTDGGASWNDHNTNLALTQFYDGSIHPTNPNFAIGGSQDNGTSKWTGGATWPWIFGGDGASSAISSSNPNNHWAVSFQNLGIRRTTNGGATFSVADGGIDKTGVPFIARFEKCPANDDVFIAGTDNIWRSNNFFSGPSATWTDNLSGTFGSGITALAFAPSDASCNTYAFGTASGSLRLTTNGGTNWTDIDVSNGVPNRAVTDLAFDPTNANVLYVTLSGFDEGTPGQPGHVFKTTNALSPSPTWTNVSPPVNIPHNTIVVDGIDPNVVYVGTDLGVWSSTSAGASWTHMGPGTGLPNVAVFDLKLNNNTGRLVAFTHGRGAFALNPGSKVGADFDGDGKTDVGIYRSGLWFVNNSGGGTSTLGWGGAVEDIPVPGDYDGDGKWDHAVYRAGNGAWFILRSSDGGQTAIGWGGAAQDIPVQGDYDGDGKADVAVYRAGNGAWFILRSSDGGQTIVGWGGAVSDIPVPADYDGDGKADVAVFRAGNGAWFINNSGGGTTTIGWGGAADDVAVPADYDGDGKADVAVYRASTGAWFIRRSSDGGQTTIGWGGDPSDIAVPADYDGDGKADVAVYRASTGAWFIRRSSDGGQTTVGWGGAPQDVPVN